MTKRSYVYIIGPARKADAYKVGFSSRPKTRLAELNRKQAEPLIIHYMERVPQGLPAILIERQVHQALLPHRTEGEWFDLPLYVIKRELINAVRCPARGLPSQLPAHSFEERQKRIQDAYADARQLWKDTGG